MRKDNLTEEQKANLKKGRASIKNRRGRPKGAISVMNALKKIVRDNPKAEWEKKLAEAAMKAAKKGDYRFWKEIVDRLDGPVQQQISADGAGQIVINIGNAKPPTPDKDANIEN